MESLAASWSTRVSSEPPEAVESFATVSPTGAPKGNIGRTQAYWVTADTIAWNPGAVSASWNVALHYDATAALPSIRAASRAAPRFP